MLQPGLPRLLGLLALVGVPLVLAGGCEGGGVVNPFDAGHEGASGAAGQDAATEAATGDADTDAAPEGEPCALDSQCGDGIGCTTDACDPSTQRCRHTPRHDACADTEYCNGAERCDRALGCRAGEPVDCSGESLCSFFACDEASRSCVALPRDADGDGDVVWNCPGGGDCDDTDPRVHSGAPEICANGKDDDCDGELDEPGDCVTPAYDTCVSALEVRQEGTVRLSAAAARLDYPVSCYPSTSPWRDLVLAVEVPSDAPYDLDVWLTSNYGEVGLASVEPCGTSGRELGCALGGQGPLGQGSARLLLREVPAGYVPIFAATSSESPLDARVRFLPASPKPVHETCGTARELYPEVHEQLRLVDAARDVTTRCGQFGGELVYRLTLDRTQDVEVTAVTLEGVGLAVLSLRDDCGAQGERSCTTGDPARLLARALPAGTYYLAVSGTAPIDVDLALQLSEPSPAPADETCVGAPPAPLGKTTSVSLLGHLDDVQPSCSFGAVDAAYEVSLPERSDLLLVERFSSRDVGFVSLARAPCDASERFLACGSASRSPARALARDLAAGSYRAIVEASYGGDVTLTPVARPASRTTWVAFADTCEEAVRIPETGGSFEGNTANANADYPVVCDLGGQGPVGARDQVLRLELSRRRRVLLDLQGSAYSTLLAVKRGPECPGTELVDACSAGYLPERSFLDLVLEPGVYFVHIDGYASASGAWKLEAFTTEP